MKNVRPENMERVDAKRVKVKPMLAGKYDPEKLTLPVYAQPKYDGIRAIIMAGQAYSRTLKPIRNRHIQESLLSMDDSFLDGLDGELVVGDPTASDCYRKTSSGVMSEGGKPDFMYIVFDCWDCPDLPFKERIKSVNARVGLVDTTKFKVVVSLTHHLHTESSLDMFYDLALLKGYEGIILRSPDGPYKYNRSTTNEGYLLKHKPFKDAEAVILDFTEKMHNGNPAELDERGYTKHSGHKANLVPQGTLGALTVSMIDGSEMGSKDFNVGTGFDDALRQKIWDNRSTIRGQIIKFKYADIGNYNVPRFPVFLGFRDKLDLS